MPGRRVDLQPPISITIPTQQEARFALRIPGGARSGIAILNVLSAPATGTTFNIYTASDLSLDPNMAAPAAGIFWTSVGSVSSVTTTGSKIIVLSQMGEWIRWAAETGTGTPRFSIVVHLFDA
jgi:hypothetical protein